MSEQGLLGRPADLAYEADAVTIDVRRDLLVEECLPSGLDHAGQHERHVDSTRGCDCPVRALLGADPPDPEQIVALARLGWPGPQIDRVGDRAKRLQSAGCGRELGMADADERSLVAVVGVERRGVRGERAMQRVHERCVNTVRHRQPCEAAVVVDYVEAFTLAGEVDLVECLCDVVDLEQRALDRVRMRLIENRHNGRPGDRARSAEQRHVVPSTDERLGQCADHRLDAAVAG